MLIISHELHCLLVYISFLFNVEVVLGLMTIDAISVLLHKA